jgi:hypothetical protein
MQQDAPGQQDKVCMERGQHFTEVHGSEDNHTSTNATGCVWISTYLVRPAGLLWA